MATGFQAGVPIIDWSSLADIPKAYNESKTRRAREETLAQIGNGRLDMNTAAQRLVASGDIQGATTLANLASSQASLSNNQRDFAFRQAEAERAQRNADRSYGLQQSQYGLQERALSMKGDGIEGQVEQRKRAAIAQGIEPTSPAFQSYVLTGKMPREDQQPLTATDKKAIIEADEGVMSGEVAIEGLKKAKELSPRAYSGPGADIRGYGSSLFGSESGGATVELNNLITTNALTQLKSIFGGMPTEGERKILLEVQGSVNLPDSARQKIYDRAIIAANKRLEFNRQRAAAMRGGTFYKPQGQPQGQPQAQPQAMQPTQNIPESAANALQAEPWRREEFEIKYGKGSAAKVLGL